MRTLCAENPTFRKLVMEDPGLSKYLESHPNMTKTQMRDLLDSRPDFVAVFDKARLPRASKADEEARSFHGDVQTCA